MVVEARGRARVRWLAVPLAAALLAGACGGGDADSGPSAETGQVTASETEADTSADADASTATGAADEDGAASGAPDDTQEEEKLLAPVDTTTTLPPDADGDGDGGSEQPAEPEPQFGGTLRVAVEAEGDGLNPAANSFAVSAYVMTYPVFDPVAYWDEQGRWIPYLAESFTPIDGGASWQMKLREGVRFHDGTELDADDAVATFEAQLADPIVSLAIRPFYPATGAIEKIDDLTVQYNPIHVSAGYPRFVASQLGMIAPSEWLARAASDPALNQMPVGTGPFMIESRTQDDVTVLVRNPDYWAADLTDVYLDRIEVYPITDTAIAAERLAAGDIDLMVTSNSDAILTLRDAEADGVRTIENIRSSEDFAMMNTAAPPFDDIRARQALTFATDRDAYVLLIRQGTGPTADTMFHPDLIWHNPNVKQETNMPERAGPLVAAYCADNPGNCTDGKINIELQYSGPSVAQTRIADLLIDSWEDYFDITQDEPLQDDHITQVVLGQYNVATWRQFGAVDPDNDVLWITCLAVGFIALNFPRYCDEERDALLYEQRAIDDVDRRVEIWHEIQENIRDSYSYIFFNHANWTIGVRDNVNNVCGQTSPADGVTLFCNNQGRVQLHQVWLG